MVSQTIADSRTRATGFDTLKKMFLKAGSETIRASVYALEPAMLGAAVVAVAAPTGGMTLGKPRLEERKERRERHARFGKIDEHCN